MGCACCKSVNDEVIPAEDTPLLRENKMMANMRQKINMNAATFIKVWKSYDRDGNGYLENTELDAFLDDFIKSGTKERNTIKLKEMKQHLLQIYDIKQNRKFDMAEFTKLLPVEKNFLGKFPKSRSMSRTDYDEIFEHYDQDQSGYIDIDELIALIKDLFQRDGQTISTLDLESYADAIREIYDIDKNGQINKEELRLLLAKSA